MEDSSARTPDYASPRLQARFWVKVDKNGPVPDHRPDLGPCWIWTAAVHPRTGYGIFAVICSGPRSGRMVEGAHRVAYRIHTGHGIPHGWHTDHLCRVRCCVNPKHLEAVTHAENIRRGDTPDSNRRRAVLRTHCDDGHELTEENVYRRPGKNVRECRICRSRKKRVDRLKRCGAAPSGRPTG